MLSHQKRPNSSSPQNTPKRSKQIILHLSNSHDVVDWVGNVDLEKLQKLEARMGMDSRTVAETPVEKPAPAEKPTEKPQDKPAERLTDAMEFKHPHTPTSRLSHSDEDKEVDELEDVSLSTPTHHTKRKKFTEDEDAKILSGWEQFGDWEQVAKWGWPNQERTAEQIRNRWKRISKKKRPDDDLINVAAGYRVGTTPGFSSPPHMTSTATSPSKNRSITSYFKRDESKPHRMSEGGDLQKLQEQVLHLTQDKEDLIQQLTSLKQEAEQRIKAAEDGKNVLQEKTKNVLVELLMARARDKARDRRRRANENSMRLANMTVERRGLDMVERWEEGYEFRDLEDSLAKINKEKEEIEKKRKSLKQKQDKKKDEMDPGMIAEQEEIFKLRLLALKREENDVMVKMNQLQGERDLHVREVRRIRDESASRFGNHPILSNRYLLLEMLGRGGFSEVWKGFDLSEMQLVAVKIHSLNSAWSDERKRSYTRHALREYQIHKQLVHPRIVRLFDVFEIDDSAFATVLEYCDGSDLETHLQLQPNKILSEREARSIISQCFSALKYLNQLPQPVIHYDLKPGNLLFSHGQVLLTDFGLSKIVEHDVRPSLGLMPRPRDIELTSQGAGTYWYLPPECFNRDGPALISSKVDVWSMGVIFYEMLYGVKPFGANQSQQSILRGDTITNEAHMVTFPSKPVVSQETKDFIRKCLEYRKERRPDVLQICSDVYLAGK